jgi:hypothetical protein
MEPWPICKEILNYAYNANANVEKIIEGCETSFYDTDPNSQAELAAIRAKMYQNGLNSGNIIGVVTYLTNELMK